MKPWIKPVSLCALLALGYYVGRWHAHSGAPVAAGSGAASASRRILHYACPMHPSYTSPQPGDAPCCGMRLEPVYAEGGPTPAAKLPPGAVKLDSERRQLIGVQLGKAERTSGTYNLRILGRVAADETRIYRLVAASAGWIVHAYPNSTGSFVKRGQALAAFYSPEFLSAQQAYIFALNSLDRFRKQQEAESQIQITEANAQQAANSLRNLGMGEIQLAEIAKTRTRAQEVQLMAPVDGFILARNISPDLRYDRGTEFYRIADLSRVWIVADLFENEARFVRAGQRADVRYQGRSFAARMSDVLPQFDPNTRTLQARFEVDNPGFTLRPDMFVDVEYPVAVTPAVTVPAEAIVDTGKRKTVFVDRGEGILEPRQVETLWRLGDRVAISHGIQDGESIVVSGNFLLDSESRMRMPAGAGKIAAIDPVCGMEADPKTAASSEYAGKRYYFCSEDCRKKFNEKPKEYVAGAAGARADR